MPGLFGAVGSDQTQLAELEDRHRNRWRSCQVVSGKEFVIGGASPGPQSAIHREERKWVAVDGGIAAYQESSRFSKSNAGDIYNSLLDRRGVPRVPGSVALLHPGSGRVRLASDWSGAFPAYWSVSDGVFAFSTLLDVLASVFDSGIDAVGVVAFVKDGYYPGSRTCFEDVQRVQPGQIVRFGSTRAGVSVEETSRAWARSLPLRDAGEMVEALWSSITESVSTSIFAQERERPGVFLSAGWDSRTLLGAALRSGEASRLLCLSHGDIESRELGLVADLCEDTGCPYRQRPLEAEDFALDHLRSTHALCGTAQFPYWRTSSRLLSELGVGCVSAGIYGEVSGGHYGPAMFLAGWRKISSVLWDIMAPPILRPRPAGEDVDDAQAVCKLLRSGVKSVQDFFHPEFWHQSEDLPKAFGAAVESEIGRLKRRGVNGSTTLAEAYLTEHRAGQYINAQLRTARVESSVAIPFAHRNTLDLASRLPFSAKIHNRAHQKMLTEASVSLLGQPSSAVLVPLSTPILVQEATRAARKAWEEGRWWLHNITSGQVPRPRLSWIDLEFLRETHHLRDLAADFRWNGWNKRAVDRLVERVHTRTWNGSLHKPVLQLLKLYTLDLDLRAASE